MLEIEVIKDISIIDINDILGFIEYFPENIKAKYQNITNVDYLKESIIGYLMLIFKIKEKYGIYYFPNYKPGKPFDKFLDFYFSISHSNNMVCLAVSDKNIGVDIEKIRNVSKRFIAKMKMKTSLEALTSWTKREARFKLNNNLKLMDDNIKDVFIYTKVKEEDGYIISIAFDKENDCLLDEFKL